MVGDVYCVACGCSFETGQVPREWQVVVAASRGHFDRMQPEEADALIFPDDLTPRELDLIEAEVAIGRRDDSKGIIPHIDLSVPVCDVGVSRRHARLSRRSDDDWELVDQGSANGTWLNDGEEEIPAHTPVVVHDGDRIFIGFWTVITLRRNVRRSGG